MIMISTDQCSIDPAMRHCNSGEGGRSSHGKHVLGVEDYKILRRMTSPKYFLLLGFWVITRHHGGVTLPGLEDIFPTDLPELFQPTRTPNSIGKR